MNWWRLQRVPEPEEMDEPEEISSYRSAAAEAHLNAIDETFVDHVARLLRAARLENREVLGLDVGTGPAQIPIKILCRFAGVKIVAIDAAAGMLACARQNAGRAGISGRLWLARADGLHLPFPDAAFSMVLCNSMLHHARDSVQLLRELFRVAAPQSVVLVRDLRRPSRPWLPWHLWRHGRRYHGCMRELFNASVRAAYTPEELRDLARQAGISGTRVFRFRGAHIGIERAGAPETLSAAQSEPRP